MKISGNSEILSYENKMLFFFHVNKPRTIPIIFFLCNFLKMYKNTNYSLRYRRFWQWTFFEWNSLEVKQCHQFDSLGTLLNFELKISLNFRSIQCEEIWKLALEIQKMSKTTAFSFSLIYTLLHISNGAPQTYAPTSIMTISIQLWYF